MTGSLIYLPGGPFILESPFYMSFTWTVVLIQIGYIGLLLSKCFPIVIASFITASIGAVNIPLYEEWAKGANWWFYQNTKMLGNTPWYIIVGEFLICLLLPSVLYLVKKVSFVRVVMLGMLQGLWIWVSYAIGFGLVG